MTSLSARAATMQKLSLVAMEEASRRGQRDADLEHLFMALVINDQVAGRALRSVGISLDQTRNAVEALHATQLESIGIAADEPCSQRIVFHETGGYEWTPRALEILKHAGGKNAGNSSSVLRELLEEPSGLIRALLGRLDTSATEILTALTTEERHRTPSSDQPTQSREEIVGRAEVFVPAPIEAVWELLADPSRMPVWNAGIGSVDLPDLGENPRPFPQESDSWTVHPHTRHTNGKPIRIRNQYRRRRMELLLADRPHHISWRTTYPDLERGNTNTLVIDLADTPGGTQVRLTSSWNRRTGWRRIVGLPLHPVRHFLLWLTAFQLGAGISRSFR
ncbi:uncharacterized protein YndB with AHSA1/START domain [Arthrobacter sp. CAN_A6]|uniref:SRPBCC family protein n=1 Tax=Arthrobacter sp. CAN_A6 TaxID=2787721 RepID=UPI0018CA1C37